MNGTEHLSPRVKETLETAVTRVLVERPEDPVAAISRILLEDAARAEEEAKGERVLHELVSSCDQMHLTEGWIAGENEDGKRRLYAQLGALDRTMPGGVCDYVSRARRLLEDSRVGKNPFEGYVPSVPSGFSLAFGSEEFRRYEKLGGAMARGVAFVLVAGGLGERLGFSGIKLALPSELLSGTCYLELYIRHVLALQALPPEAPDDDVDAAVPPSQPPMPTRRLPVVIMTSDDTDAPTRALLAARGNFGLEASQLYIIRQGKVPCLADGAARLALDPSDRYSLLTKPHGHGDVHALLHGSGLARQLLAGGCTHLVFLQDTNALVFGGIPAALGVSITHGLAMNTLSVPRRAGDASGALMALTAATGEGAAPRTIVVNVEYNQLDALVRASLDARGDYNDADTGFSPFPGNTNQLIFDLATYVEALEATGGAMPEFVNPKYTDASRTAFKSPTRLECMMQDLPWILPAGRAVSFTSLDASFYAPVKNSHADALKKAAAGQASGGAAAGEHAIYAFHRRLLAHAGCRLPPPSSALVGGLPVDGGPLVVLGPRFRPTLGVAHARLVGGRGIELSARSSLYLDGDITLERLTLDGALSIRAAAGTKVVVRQLCIVNEGVELRELSRAELQSTEVSETARLRGYELVQPATARELVFDQPGTEIIFEL